MANEDPCDPLAFEDWPEGYSCFWYEERWQLLKVADDGSVWDPITKWAEEVGGRIKRHIVGGYQKRALIAGGIVLFGILAARRTRR